MVIERTPLAAGLQRVQLADMSGSRDNQLQGTVRMHGAQNFIEKCKPVQSM
jgi:hypothetical protein